MKPLGPCNQSRGPSLLLKPHSFYKVAQVETRLESGTPNPTVFYALPRHRRLSFGLFHPGRYCGTQLACRLPAVAGKQGLRYSFQGCAVPDFRVLHGISPPRIPSAAPCPFVSFRAESRSEESALRLLPAPIPADPPHNVPRHFMT